MPCRVSIPRIAHAAVRGLTSFHYGLQYPPANTALRIISSYPTLPPAASRSHSFASKNCIFHRTRALLGQYGAWTNSQYEILVEIESGMLVKERVLFIQRFAILFYFPLNLRLESFCIR